MAVATTGILDLARFAATPLVRQPFDHLIVPGFIAPAALPGLNADFPAIAKGGSYPTETLKYGGAFAALVEEIESDAMRRAFAAKFDIDLEARPVMITVRGHTRAKDGRIHTDSKTKLLTALLYFNDDWNAEGGRLRLLRSGRDLEDYAAEVPPEAGTLVAFRCTPEAWHGHKPFIGQRRSIQLNWLTDAGVLKRELRRHALSALSKKLLRFGA